MSASDEFLAREDAENLIVGVAMRDIAAGSDLHSVRWRSLDVPTLDELRDRISAKHGEILHEWHDLIDGPCVGIRVSRAQHHRYRARCLNVLRRLEDEVADLCEMEERLMGGWTP